MAMEGLGRLYNVCLGGVPVDLSTAGITGKYVDLSTAASCDIVVFKAAGTAGDDPTFTLYEAQDSGGTGAQTLAKIDHYYLKDAATLTAATLWVKKTQTAAATIADPGGAGTSAEHQQIIVIPVMSVALSDGFTHIRLDCADVGANAQLGSILYVLNDLEVQRTPANLASSA